jgi:UDP-GlcNAc:undecaprenyl-phosphate/decaprenyl-phosphate GlcNAc-1-phosphate transferase
MSSLPLLAVMAGGAFVVTTSAIPALALLAARRHWLDVAGGDELKIHKAPIPFVGGLGIAAGFFVAVLVLVGGRPVLLAPVALIGVLGLALLTLGLRDDLVRLPPVFRLGMEVLAGTVLAGGLGILGLVDPSALPLGRVGFVLVVAGYVAAAVNAVNLLDGLDGLAGGAVLISCLGFVVAGLARQHPLVPYLAGPLAAALAGFLLYNYNPASVFMGDNGSYFLGFLLASLSVLTVATGGAAWRDLAGVVLLVGLPFVDTTWAVVRRLRRGVSPFHGDRSHLYDTLRDRGLSVRSVAVVCYVAQTALVAAGVCVLWK